MLVFVSFELTIVVDSVSFSCMNIMQLKKQYKQMCSELWQPVFV